MRRPLAAMALTAAAVLLSPRPAAANIVNVQGSLAGEPEEGWSGSLGLSLDWRTGNTHLIQVSGSGAALYRRGRLLGLVLLRGEYGDAQGTRLSEKVFEHLRGRVQLDEHRRWMWEAFVQHEYDAFRRLQVRALAGTGPAARVLDCACGSAVVGAAYLIEYERFDRRPSTDAGAEALHHRLSAYATGVYKIDDRVSASATLYVQPRLDRPSDLRLLAETSLTTRLGERLSLQSSFVVSVDRSPPEGIASSDTQLKTGLTFTF